MYNVNMRKKVVKKRLVTKKLIKKQTKKTSKKVTKTKAKKEVAKETIHDLHKIFRRKKILCHTCKNREKCLDAITKRYPYVCMIYVADETLEK